MPEGAEASLDRRLTRSPGSAEHRGSRCGSLLEGKTVLSFGYEQDSSLHL
jgi:hypothetical protein